MKQQVLLHLKEKYQKDFAVVQIDMQRNEGNWGHARLKLISTDSPPVTFKANYKYSENKMIFEDYLPAYWAESVRASIVTKYTSPSIEARTETLRITGNRSLVINGLKLPVQYDYQAGIHHISDPAIFYHLEGAIKTPANLQPILTQARAMAISLRQTGFAKVVIAIHLSAVQTANLPDTKNRAKNDRPEYSLQFQVSKRTAIPTQSDLLQLIQKKDDLSLSQKTEALFNQAQQLLQKGDKKSALNRFQQIVRDYDSPYRYRPYIVAQSGNVYESMVAAGDLLFAMQNKKQARMYYQKFLDRVALAEVKLKFASIERRVQKRMTNN